MASSSKGQMLDPFDADLTPSLLVLRRPLRAESFSAR